MRIPMGAGGSDATAARSSSRLWRKRIRALASFVRGPYQRAYDSQGILFAVVHGQKRMSDLYALTQQELTATRQQNLADLFRFTALPPDTEPKTLFLSPTWRRPFDTQPVPLLEDV